jgi:hypothetical protein
LTAENQVSGPTRRKFVRKLVGLAAVGGLSSVLWGRQVDEARAVAVSGGTVVSGEMAFWLDASGALGSFQSHVDPAHNNIAVGSGNLSLVGDATVGGGTGNVAGSSGATVGGGQNNSASGFLSAIGGGYGNITLGDGSTVAGGQTNKAIGVQSAVGGGYDNVAAGSYATVGGGHTNIVSGYISTVPGGAGNATAASYSFAAGSTANVLSSHHGSMLFSDDTGLYLGPAAVPFNSAAPDEFAVRATGGFRFVTGVDASGNVTNLVAINSSGSLGIRTGSPSYALDLQTSGSPASQMHVASTGTDSGGYLTSANPGNLFMSAGAAWNGSAWVAKNSTAYQYGGGTAGVRFFFDTGLTVGGTYTPTTRMFIGPTGHVGIGMSTAPAHLLQLGLDDAAKPSTNTWTIASDGRLKDPESIEPFTEGSELIKRLPHPVWFRYRKDSGLPSDRRVAGWIAQDIALVAPFMVRRTKQKLSINDQEETETLSLNTNELSYAIVNTLREILAELDAVKSKNTRLEEELVRLRMRKSTTDTFGQLGNYNDP